jgi:nicotinamide riboside kinase
MKILITGTHGTGKSSLLEELKKLPELRDFKFIGGVTREIQKLGLPINEEGSWKTQLLSAAKRIIDLLENENQDVVYDRGIIDTKIYTNYLLDNSGFDEDLAQTDQIINQIFCLFRFSFDIIIWLRPEFPLKDDGVRSQNWIFQQEIDSRFCTTIMTDNIYIFQLTGSIEERVEQFKKIYNEKKI